MLNVESNNSNLIIRSSELPTWSYGNRNKSREGLKRQSCTTIAMFLGSVEHENRVRQKSRLPVSQLDGRSHTNTRDSDNHHNTTLEQRWSVAMAQAAALTLANIPLDVQIGICMFLHPSDILALRKVCRY